MSFRRRRVIVTTALVGAWLVFGSMRGEGSDHLVLDWRNPRLASTSELELAYPRAW
jgi:hypothetical protein